MPNKGEVFAFETDTVWGFGCHPMDVCAIDKIYEIKNRDRSKPLILMSNKLDNLLPYVQSVPQNALTLMQRAYPGALTVVLQKSSSTLQAICADFNTVGIRVPNHSGFWELCKKVEGNVLATTSANISNEPPCATYQDTLEKFGSVCTVVKPNSTYKQASASTVVAFFEDGVHKVLRQGDFVV